jgi:hypothetical protein
MTLDQVFMLLADRKQLMSRRKTLGSLDVVPMADKDGFIKGRAKDGSPMLGRIAGKSLARQLMERKQHRERQQRDAERQARSKRKRR